MHALEVRNLSKSFGKLKAVDNVSFSIPEGSVFGLIGRNGAGKTTTIRMMMNIFLPDEGEVILRGAKIGQDFRNKVGYLPEERGLYKKMKVWETIMYFAELKGKTGKEIEKKANYYLKLFSLHDRKTSKVEDLSKGNQQKVQFITTVLHDPDFLILDEPFSGLDPINTDILMNLIMDFKKEGKIIILCTHLMDFAEKMCDHIALINKGQVILEGSLSDVKSRYSERNIAIHYEGNIDILQNHNLIESYEDYGNRASIKIRNKEDVQDVLKLLIDNNIKLSKFSSNEISLHEIFVALAGDEFKNNSKLEAANV